jgi:hypothetical protein
MKGKASSFDEYVEITAMTLGFSMDPSWKAAASANIETIFKLTALVDSFQLPEDIEPAPVFEA